MPKTIKRLEPGTAPSLLDAAKGNELIDSINALLNLQVNPQGFGALKVGDKNMVLDLTPIRNLINELSTVVAAYSQTTGGGGGGGGGGGDTTSIKNAYNLLLAALGGSTLTAVCDATTREITVTWNIALPPPI